MTHFEFDVLSVAPLCGYKLSLTFFSGEKKIYDMSKNIDYPVFAPLKNLSLFNQVFVENYTVCWPNDIDIAPEELYLNSAAVG